MKKKIIIAVIIIAIIAAAATFIRPGKAEEETTTIPDGQPVTVNLEPETTEKEKEASYNKKVTVTLPADFVDAKYKDNLDAFAEANGYISAKYTDDGSVKIKMRALSYSLILSNIGMDTIQSIAYLLDSEDYPYFKDLLKYNDDFSKVIIAVDAKEYEKLEDKETFLGQIALACLFYQSYDEDSEGKCEITVCEEKTNILIETKEFTLKDLENIS